MLGLDTAYMHAKFDHSSFSRFADMVGALQNLKGLRDLTIPLSGMVYHPWALATINLSTIFEVSISLPTTRYERRYKIWKMGWFEVVKGHSSR